MTKIIEPLKKGHLSLALVCVALGFMITFQFRIAMDQRASLPYQRIEVLTERLVQTEKERDALADQVSRLEATIAQASTQDAVAQQTLAELRQRAGLVAMRGAGLVVTIDDSNVATKPGENQNLYVVHDDDILRVINELRAAGAEVISLNGQRLISTSEIRCAGPTLSVNNVRSAPPYEIIAIGDPKTLEAALTMRGGVADTLLLWGIKLQLRREDAVLVPPYKGVTPYRFAKAVEESQP